MYRSSILLIEANADTLQALTSNFQREGATVTTFNNATRGYDYLKKGTADLIVTDWNMAIFDGLDLCKLLKRSQQHAHIPLVMLTDRESEIDAVTALEVGVEDYIRKPVKVKELIVRMKNILRRKENYYPVHGLSNGLTASAEDRPIAIRQPVIKLNEVSLDNYSHKAYLLDKELSLTYSEFKLLELFISNPRRVYQRSTIIEKISGIDYFVTERSVDVMVVGLRKKLGEYKKYLETVRGVGYRFIG
ncbi:two-component system, OmpR family, phosphate regulon response regulator PhoB [Cyclobacterium xiamenense]|uniref:Two-component system, OmpR family, phosphate regulon response regulator PhoB n=1 Tax=Cyclobacterium xiamenense TaxID=1297121 RepID=A0A1H6TV15_9BACT|nr:response regulator transcription factor [Cyclobacterium xiamenense]SEI79592.1 two-component system, OmpR family, phosphate regulon response regulator PhoB [Cyclobacterium xiamenense]